MSVNNTNTTPGSERAVLLQLMLSHYLLKASDPLCCELLAEAVFDVEPYQVVNRFSAKKGLIRKDSGVYGLHSSPFAVSISQPIGIADQMAAITALQSIGAIPRNLTE